MTTELPYRLGRTEQRGTVFHLRPGQALAISLGLVALVSFAGAGGVGGAVLGVVALGAATAVATVPINGRGLDEWVPVVASHVVRVRGGALCGGAVLDDGARTGIACLRWPTGQCTSVAVLEHRGLRALADEPRALADALGTWLRGLAVPGVPRCVVSLLTATGPGMPAHAAPWCDAGSLATSFVAVTADEPVDVAVALAAVGVTGARALGARALDAMLAQRVAPAAGSMLGSDVAARWSHLEAPASVHASFVILRWPEGAVDEQVLAPLLISRDRRWLCITGSVEEHGRARARVARLRTAGAADEVLAGDRGFLASAESDRDARHDDERAAELALGHGSVRLVGVVAIDADDVLALEAAAARLCSDATACGIQLRRCDGDHRRGVLATVPGWCRP